MCFNRQVEATQPIAAQRISATLENNAGGLKVTNCAGNNRLEQRAILVIGNARLHTFHHPSLIITLVVVWRARCSFKVKAGKWWVWHN